ncbi:NUDIX hydrolase [Nocardioides sp. J54]|uniref:NUDIX hydrolase n=1 Tax=Nocardioides sp. J54 TaxID=935866 RepID=UPI00048C2C41|nr:NUDIX domain-containing protein [Nocardioides sp. J54]
MPDILAAGVVVFRPGREVLLVHRPRYDDWSFPKGKLDPGEHPVAAAVREVEEETGLRVRLGPPLPSQRYPVNGRGKTVHYWTGRVTGSDDVAGYEPNDEIDAVEWVPHDDARERLTYEHDRRTLQQARRLRRRTHAVIVLRHGLALERDDWEGEDADRPLRAAGEEQAARLVDLLAAYGVQRVVTSSSTRCVQSVRPYADAHGLDLDLRRRLSEEKATAGAVARIVEELLAGDQPAVLCTHRPVLPLAYDAAGIAPDDVEELAKAEMLVLHVRKGAVVAVERHQPPRG